jgi:hypothetical protein
MQKTIVINQTPADHGARNVGSALTIIPSLRIFEPIQTKPKRPKANHSDMVAYLSHETTASNDSTPNVS